MKKHHTEQQILGILREAEQGKPLAEVLRAHGIAAGTYYRWKSKYGGLEPSHPRRPEAEVGCADWLGPSLDDELVII